MLRYKMMKFGEMRIKSFICDMKYTKPNFANTTHCCWVGEIGLRDYAT